MTSSLPGAWSLIVDSWNTFVKHWSTTVRYAAWFFLATVVQQVYVFFPEDGGRTLVAILCLIISSLIGIWASIRLYQAILALEGGQTLSAKTTATAMLLVIPLAVLGIVQMFATLGGLILLILPGIYVGVRLAFAQLFLIDAGVTLQGTLGDKVRAILRAVGAAISQSWEKTKGRFWAIFGRQAGAAILFLILTMIVGGVAVAIITVIVGGPAALTAIRRAPMGQFLLNLVNGLVQVALVALMATFQVKLFKAVKKV